jgi:hypothetical protein
MQLFSFLFVKISIFTLIFVRNENFLKLFSMKNRGKLKLKSFSFHIFFLCSQDSAHKLRDFVALSKFAERSKFIFLLAIFSSFNEEKNILLISHQRNRKKRKKKKQEKFIQSGSVFFLNDARSIAFSTQFVIHGYCLIPNSAKLF